MAFMGFAEYTLSVQQNKTWLELRRVVLTFAVLALTAWFVRTWVSNIEQIVRYYTPIPYADYWLTAGALPRFQALDVTVLWVQHNEHRLVFPYIVFAADDLLLHGRQVLPIVLSFACYFGTWLTAAWVLASDRIVRKEVRISGALLAGTIAGWKGISAILANPMLLQWTLTTVAAMLALVFLVRLKESGENRYLTAVVVSAAISNYSSANGLLLWPILLCGALLLRVRRAQIIGIACAAVLCSGLYFVDYRFTGNLAVLNLIRHPVYLLKFLGCYLANPLSTVGPVWAGAGIGITGMCLAAVLTVAAWRAGLARSRTGIVLFGSYWYVVLTGVMIAAGRMNSADTGANAAKGTRYLSEPLIAWAVLVMLCVWLNSRLVKRADWGEIVVCAALVFISFSRLGGWVRERDVEFANVELGAIAIQNEIFDPAVIVALFSWEPHRIEAWSQRLRQNNLSVFYKGYRRVLGHAVGDLGALFADVPGEITQTSPVSDGVEVVGWAEWDELRGSSGWVLLGSDAEKIVGFGQKLRAGFPPQLRNLRTPERLGWVGFVHSKFRATSVHAYVMSKHGLVALQGSAAVPIYHTGG